MGAGAQLRFCVWFLGGIHFLCVTVLLFSILSSGAFFDFL